MWLFGSRKRNPAPPQPADRIELLARRIVLVEGVIDDEVAVDVISRLLFLQHKDSGQPVEVWVNSVGGSLSAGFAIADTMRELRPLVHTVCRGRAHGIAAIIVACGRKGCRSSRRDAVLSITPITGPNLARVPEEELNKDRQLLAGVLSEQTGQPRESVIQDVVTGRQFDAPGALAYGLVDRLTEE